MRIPRNKCRNAESPEELLPTTRKDQRVRSAEAEVRIMHEMKPLLIGLAILVVIVVALGFLWRFLNQ